MGITTLGVTRTIDREALAWAAGFYEGEGSIVAHSHPVSGYSSISVTVSQASTEPLERFKAALGLGKLVTRPPSKLENRQTMYLWRVCSYERAQAVIAMLWPWLSIRRREQARRALQLVQAHWTRPHKAARTHCKNGHEYTEANTRMYQYGTHNPYRMCRACQREAAARDYASGQGLQRKREWLKRRREAA